MDEPNNPRGLLEQHKKQLDVLQRKTAKFGPLTVPIHLKNLIDEEKKVIARIETMLVKKRAITGWDLSDAISLVDFVEVEDPVLDDDRISVKNLLGGKGFPELVESCRHDKICEKAYLMVQSHGITYEYESASKDYTRQPIRPPRTIYKNHEGTCLDLACLFAALLETMQARPVIVRIFPKKGSCTHALVGCWPDIENVPFDAETDPLVIKDGDLVRGAMASERPCERLILFETTGVARRSDDPARHDGLLSYEAAKKGAVEMLRSDSKWRLDFLVDIVGVREHIAG